MNKEEILKLSIGMMFASGVCFFTVIGLIINDFIHRGSTNFVPTFSFLLAGWILFWVSKLLKKSTEW